MTNYAYIRVSHVESLTKTSLDTQERTIKSYAKSNGFDIDYVYSEVVSGGVGMPINPYLWKASLETIDFMPLSSTDPFAGTIITDWYISQTNENERCKLNIFINGQELKTENLKVLSFCQDLKNNQWVNKNTNKEDNIKLENAILNKAKKLKIGSG